MLHALLAKKHMVISAKKNVIMAGSHKVRSAKRNVKEIWCNMRIIVYYRGQVATVRSVMSIGEKV